MNLKRYSRTLLVLALGAAVLATAAAPVCAADQAAAHEKEQALIDVLKS